MTFQFPPYGQLSRFYLDMVVPGSLAPISWRPQLPPPERESTYLQWRRETVELINQVLWPAWDDASSSWRNGDHEKMLALTLADFQLYSKIEASRVFYRTPNSPVRAASIPSHHDYFEDEDTAQFGERYYFYDTTLPSDQLALVIPALKQTLENKAGSVSIQIKKLLQRPRAYQVAKLLGHKHKYEYAASSMTPSMSSGHCFEGCLIAAGIFEAWLSRSYNPTSDQLQALAQFGVDVGDRRVFAGIHYPSDNLASWVMDLRLINEVCPDRRIGRFLAAAITRQSYVFQLLKDSAIPVHMDAVHLVESLAKATDP
jgi:hypothetical protein